MPFWVYVGDLWCTSGGRGLAVAPLYGFVFLRPLPTFCPVPPQYRYYIPYHPFRFFPAPMLDRVESWLPIADSQKCQKQLISLINPKPQTRNPKPTSTINPRHRSDQETVSGNAISWQDNGFSHFAMSPGGLLLFL